MMVPLMIVSAIAYFINKGILKYSIYTIGLAEQGNLVSQENQEHRVLRRIKLKYLLEKDFVVLHPEDTPTSRSADIIHTTRNIFPVVDSTGELKGVLFSDQLLELLLSAVPEKQNSLIKDITQPANKVININTSMQEVMRVMDSLDTRILPVTDSANRYQGFVTKNGIFNKYRHILAREGDMYL